MTFNKKEQKVQDFVSTIPAQVTAPILTSMRNRMGELVKQMHSLELEVESIQKEVDYMERHPEAERIMTGIMARWKKEEERQ